MPSQYTLRNFTEGGLYHIYNRISGNEELFRSAEDYQTFIFYLYIYLKSPKSVLSTYPSLPFRLQVKNLHKEIDALAYCLMPNHCHLFLHTPHPNLSVFNRRLLTGNIFLEI